MVREHRTRHVCRLTFDRPGQLNAFTVAGYTELRRHLERAADDEDVRVVVLTGAGRAFSAGADRSLLDGSAPDLADAGAEFDALVSTLSNFPKPLLAAVNGAAVGIGCTMLLHCDLVIAGASARFRFPFTALGVAPEAGSSVLLTARCRWDDALWAMLSSEWVEADAAREMGLAWRVVPDDQLLDHADVVAATLAGHDPAAVEATKRLLTTGRADAVRTASRREMDAMRALASRAGPPGEPAT